MTNAPISEVLFLAGVVIAFLAFMLTLLFVSLYVAFRSGPEEAASPKRQVTQAHHGGSVAAHH